MKVSIELSVSESLLKEGRDVRGGNLVLLVILVLLAIGWRGEHTGGFDPASNVVELYAALLPSDPSPARHESLDRDTTLAGYHGSGHEEAAVAVRAIFLVFCIQVLRLPVAALVLESQGSVVFFASSSYSPDVNRKSAFSEA